MVSSLRFAALLVSWHAAIALRAATTRPPTLELWSGPEQLLARGRALAQQPAVPLPASLLAVFESDADVAVARRALLAAGVSILYFVPATSFQIVVADSAQLAAVSAIANLHSVIPARAAHKARALAGSGTEPLPGIIAASSVDACAVAAGLTARVRRAGGRVRVVGAHHGACAAALDVPLAASASGDAGLDLSAAAEVAVLVTPAASRVVVAALGGAGCAPPMCGPVPRAIVDMLTGDVRVTTVESVTGAPIPANAYARGALQSSDPFNFLDGAPREYGACTAPAPAACYSQAIPAPPGFNLPDRLGAPAPAAAAMTCSALACGQDWEATQSVAGVSPLSALGLDGSRQLLGVADSGVDTAHPFFYDASGAAVPVTRSRPDPSNVSTAHRKIALYFAFMDADDFDGHGTHCAGTTGGSLQSPVAPWAAPLTKYVGMAPGARFVVWDHECSPGNACTCPPGYPCTCDFSPNGTCGEVDGAFVMPLDVWQTQAVLHDAGARVSSNSWDDSDLYRFQVPYYTQSASDFDGWLYANPDFLAVFAAANSGRGSFGTGVAYTTVGAPGSAKNTLCIGATQHDALSQVDLLRSLNPLASGRNCRRIVQSFTNTSVDTCTLATTAANRTCYQLAFATPRDARAAVADLALCCGCTLADVLATAPADAATQQSVYVALLTAYSSRVLASFSSRGPTADGRQKPDVTAPGVETVSAQSSSAVDAPVRPPGVWSCPADATTVRGLDAGVNGSAPVASPLLIGGAGGPASASFLLLTLEPTYITRLTLVLASETATARRVGLSLNGILPPLWADVATPGGNSSFNVSWDLRMGMPLSSRAPTLLRFVPDGGIVATVGNANALVVPNGEVGTLPPARACWGMHSGNLDVVLDTVRNDGAAAPQHTYLVPYSGTSMATPAAAGTATIARQYFVDGWWPAGTAAGASPGFHPSAALLKAVLINGASPLLARALSNTSRTPAEAYSQRSDFVYSAVHAQEGFGMLNLVRSLGIAALADGSTSAATLPTLLLPGLALVDAPAPRPAPASVALRGADPRVDHGGLTQWCVDLTRNPAVHDGVNTSIPLRVTLVWTDPPASPLSATALVNNLDLEVVDPAGAALYRGNNDELVWPHVIDSVNNVEKVIVRAPAPTIDFATGARLSRPWSIVVRGSHVPLGPQAFSLAVAAAGARLAAAGSCGPPIAANAFSADQTAGGGGGSGGGELMVSAGVAGGVWAASLLALAGGFALLWRRRGGAAGGGADSYAAAGAGAEFVAAPRSRAAGSGRREDSESRPLIR